MSLAFSLQVWADVSTCLNVQDKDQMVEDLARDISQVTCEEIAKLPLSDDKNKCTNGKIPGEYDEEYVDQLEESFQKLDELYQNYNEIPLNKDSSGQSHFRAYSAIKDFKPDYKNSTFIDLLSVDFKEGDSGSCRGYNSSLLKLQTISIYNTTNNPELKEELKHKVQSRCNLSRMEYKIHSPIHEVLEEGKKLGYDTKGGAKAMMKNMALQAKKMNCAHGVYAKKDSIVLMLTSEELAGLNIDTPEMDKNVFMQNLSQYKDSFNKLLNSKYDTEALAKNGVYCEKEFLVEPVRTLQLQLSCNASFTHLFQDNSSVISGESSQMQNFKNCMKRMEAKGLKRDGPVVVNASSSKLANSCKSGFAKYDFEGLSKARAQAGLDYIKTSGLSLPQSELTISIPEGGTLGECPYDEKGNLIPYYDKSKNPDDPLASNRFVKVSANYQLKTGKTGAVNLYHYKKRCHVVSFSCRAEESYDSRPFTPTAYFQAFSLTSPPQN